MFGIIKKSLKALDKQKRLTEDCLDLYDKFKVDEEDTGQKKPGE